MLQEVEEGDDRLERRNDLTRSRAAPLISHHKTMMVSWAHVCRPQLMDRRLVRCFRLWIG